MFKKKKQLFIVTPKDPEYTVHYLGSIRTIVSKGDGCCEEPINKIWNKSLSGAKTVRAKLCIQPSGLRLVRLDPSLNQTSRKSNSNYGEQHYNVKRISYCASGKGLRSVFAWIYRHELRKSAVELRVHAVACGSTSEALDIAKQVWQGFQFCFKDFKLERKSSDRVIVRKESADGALKEALPNVPLRKKLQAQSSRGSEKESAKKLASITEGSDENDEEPGDVTQKCANYVDVIKEDTEDDFEPAEFLPFDTEADEDES